MESHRHLAAARAGHLASGRLSFSSVSGCPAPSHPSQVTGKMRDEEGAVWEVPSIIHKVTLDDSGVAARVSA